MHIGATEGRSEPEGGFLRWENRATVPDYPTLKTTTVLMVGDDPRVLINTGAMLEDLGHEMPEATSDEQTLRVPSRTQTINSTMTGQMMPAMTGAQLIDTIKAERTELPIILASG